MNYEFAKDEALSGRFIRRPHWHWVNVTSRFDKRVRITRDDLHRKTNRLLILMEDDGSERGLYHPTQDDKKAQDWEVISNAGN